MPDQWYYQRDGQQCGPISVPLLKQLAASGELKPTDLVWKEGMIQWAHARSLKGLFSEPAGHEVAQALRIILKHLPIAHGYGTSPGTARR